MQCSDIFFGCTSCLFDGTTTSCTACADGFFLNGTACGYCDPSCLTCSAQTVCTSCPAGHDFSGGTCTCSTNCVSCGGSVPQCTTCILTIFNNFAQCSSCSPTQYLDLGTYTCVPCPAGCITCDSTASCTSCPYSL
jgi:proprotein convertase subtilisin/kexin type 5